MNFSLQVFLLIFLVFVLLPAISVSIATIARYIYRKIRRKKFKGASSLIAAILITIIGLALLPPLPYIISESSEASSNVNYTGSTASITYDDNYEKNLIRYIDYDGRIYQEIIPSISNVEYYDYSEDINLKYGEPLANVMDESQSFIEKYIYTVFKYPVNSQYIYPILNEGLEDYISLDDTSLFFPNDRIEELIDYFSNPANYNYYIEDYNTTKFYDIELNTDIAAEILSLSVQVESADMDEIEKSSPEIIMISENADYDTYILNGESKNGLLLKSIGQIYEKDGQMYQIAGEDYLEDGTVSIYVVPLSDNASNILSEAFRKAGV